LSEHDKCYNGNFVLYNGWQVYLFQI